MKLTFTAEERFWMHTRINRILAEAGREKKAEPRTVALRYKFQGAASYVCLNGKERAWLKQLAALALAIMDKHGGLHEDKPMVKSILEKLCAQ